MNIKELSDNLLKIYEEISLAFSDFQNQVKLPCPPSCGKCCLNPDIETTVLEMLPLAMKIHREGKLNEWLLKMHTLDRDYCALFEGDESGAGKCGQYQERPAICRMFGVAGYSGKTQKKALSVCRVLKASAPEQLQSVEANIDAYQVPMMAQWYSQVSGLGDPSLHIRLPINQAITQALEKVAFCAWYQEM